MMMFLLDCVLYFESMVLRLYIDFFLDMPFVICVCFISTVCILYFDSLQIFMMYLLF